MTRKNCEHLEQLVEENPNDQTLGRKIQEFAVEKMNIDYGWKLFFKKTRGNAKTLGLKIRAIAKNGISSNIVSLLD